MSALLEVRGLAARYGRNAVLSDIDLTLLQGQWLSLLGPNGSGKSTLLYCLSGQLDPAAGEIRIGGHSLVRCPEKAKKLLGYAHAPERLPELLTGRQCLEIHAAARGLASIGEDILQLAQRLRLMPWLENFVDTYSLGNRQKLSVLLALVGDPPLILLDEAFNGLDPSSSLFLRQHLLERTRNGQCAVLLATHTLNIVMQCSTRIALLLEGRLVRTWQQDEVSALRAESKGAGVQALEAELARSQHLDESSTTPL